MAAELVFNRLDDVMMCYGIAQEGTRTWQFVILPPPVLEGFESFHRFVSGRRTRHRKDLGLSKRAQFDILRSSRDSSTGRQSGSDLASSLSGLLEVISAHILVLAGPSLQALVPKPAFTALRQDNGPVWTYARLAFQYIPVLWC